MTNVDRTVRNTNMLMWHRRLWLIDHGATLYFHHAPGWPAEAGRARDRFPMIKDHVLLRYATELQAVDATLSAALTDAVITRIVDEIPDSWLTAAGAAVDSVSARDSYRRHLLERLESPRPFVEEAIGGR